MVVHVVAVFVVVVVVLLVMVVVMVVVMIVERGCVRLYMLIHPSVRPSSTLRSDLFVPCLGFLRAAIELNRDGRHEVI